MTLPTFTTIRFNQVEPTLDKVLATCKKEIDEIVDTPRPHTWENIVVPLEETEDRIKQMWSPISHLHGVKNTPELREVYKHCMPKLSQHYSELGQNKKLYDALESLTQNADYKNLSVPQKTWLDHALRDLKLSGVALSSEKKQRYIELQKHLLELTAHFEENLLDATDAWSKNIIDVIELAGLPGHVVHHAQEKAQEKNLTGWLLGLDYPTYSAVMTYSDNRELRKEFYTAYTTRASDQGPHAGRWDNGSIMEDILKSRYELAQLLGFKNYAYYSLATKMAKDPDEVLSFLNDLATRTQHQAQSEREELKQYAAQQGVPHLQVWDFAFFSERLQEEKYAISQEILRPYFPEESVLQGMFEIVHRLYGITVTEKKGVDVWDPTVRFFEIHDGNKQLRGQFYIDLYARPLKRGGAWMDEAVSRRRKLGGDLQYPIAFLTCNFSPPSNNKPSLFTHEEVVTLFHEFGHGLHHLLTQVDYSGVSGISGVPMDAVEFPSQFLEHWCWEKEAVNLFARHYETGKVLPEALFEKMTEAKNYHSAMQMIRQLEFSLFDFRIHYEYDPKKGGRVQEILDDVRNKLGVIIPPKFSRFQHSFSHIFGGGYAAGYYSYKWAEVLSSDAFSKFEELGIFDRQTGQLFMETVLEQGGSRDPLELFVSFRGRKPRLDALLRHNGIIG